MKAVFTGVLFLCALFICVPATAQNATLWDDATGTSTSLTRIVPLEFFNTEGPTWDITCQASGRGGTVSCMGKVVTVPWMINGGPMICEATEDGYEDGGGEVLSDEFCKMTDESATKNSLSLGLINAAGEAGRQGAIRSIIATDQARSRNPGVTTALGMNNPGPGATEDVVQRDIEQNFFDMVNATYPAHAALLPSDFMARVGIISDDPGEWIQPMMSGGTYKSAGHVYVDGAGNRYLIPDMINVFELSENTSAGSAINVTVGTDGTPDSFLIESGESRTMLCMFNSDPRFPSAVLGVADQHIPRDMWLADAEGGGIDTVGYVNGEHVMMVMELFTDMVNVDGIVEVSVERWRFRDGGNEIRFRGGIDEPEGLAMTATAIGCSLGQNFAIPFGIAMEGDPATGVGHFAARLEFDLVPGAVTADVTHVNLTVRHITSGQVMFDETFNRNEVDPANPTATSCGGAAGFEEICTDGLDNDNDGSADCADLDCAPSFACGGTEDIAAGECEDGLDNDLDGLGDCADPDCLDPVTGLPVPACLEPDLPGGVEATCGDGEDNDADGLTDCADPDCEGEPGPDGPAAPCAAPPEAPGAPDDPGAPEEDCEVVGDEDGDGLADCADPDCEGANGPNGTDCPEAP
ncbi:MAG: hypothetical protein VX764_08820 [Planctomycetota bacterium]|nr:hypothetical protein [Planctomycetota bacterium]